MRISTNAEQRIYEISDWGFNYPDAWTITCRPGLKTFVRRSMLALLVSALVAGMLYPVRHLTDPLLAPLRVLGGVLIALAAFHVISALWQRVRIFRTGDVLHLQTLLLIPRTKSIPITSLCGMNILQQEKRSTRKSGYRPLGWLWRVLIHADQVSYEFRCEYCRRCSQDMPGRVAEFARQLQHISGLACQAPQTILWRSGQDGAYKTGRKMMSTAPSVHTHRRYHSLDDMPPAMRQSAEAAFAEMRARGLTTLRREGVTITDSNGNVQTYQSLDEMPPEVRRRFEAAMREAPRHE